MAKKKRDEGGGYNFMDTYGDMMTLLLTFFILLFSMSTVNAEKWEILVKAFSRNKEADTSQIVMIPEGNGDDIAPAVGEDTLKSPHTTDTPETEEPVNLTELAQMLQAYLEENNMEDSVTVQSDGENSVYLSFDNNLFFTSDSAVLRQSSYDILNFLGGMFKSLENEILLIRINGHTAAVPGMDNYKVNDWDLSSMRANRVATYFEEQMSLNPKKLMTNGYGKNHPIATNDTEEGRSANRRVDIQVLGTDFDKSNPDELLRILQQTLDVKLFDDTQVEPEGVEPPNLTESDGAGLTEGEGSDSVRAAEEDPLSTLSEAAKSEPPISEPVDDNEVNSAMEALMQESKTIT